MRCPKCHYISFDNGQRCRNCGYDFSLTVDVAGPDLPISVDRPEGPLEDFSLESARPIPARAPDTAGDLPLFSRGAADRSLIAPPPAPRPPLAVRRSNPGPARERSRLPDEPTLDLGAPETPGAGRRSSFLSGDEPAAAADSTTAGLVPRTAAALIDIALMASIHAAVIYLTLRLCGLTLADLRVLPPVPLGAFLLMLTAGYIVSFTVAGGQTIGKMATGIRVVPLTDRDPTDSRLTIGTAMMRAAGCLVSILTAGLGYIPALLSPDHRALHDRLADTRVVRA